MKETSPVVVNGLHTTQMLNYRMVHLKVVILLTNVTPTNLTYKIIFKNSKNRIKYRVSVRNGILKENGKSIKYTDEI